MKDLIERQAAIDAIRKHKTLYEADHGWDKTTLDALDTAIKALEQPTIEPERDEFPEECQKCVFSVFGIREPERQKGKWIEQDDSWDGVYYECSVCREPWTTIDGTPWDNGMNFCPKCGAEMEKE